MRDCAPDTGCRGKSLTGSREHAEFWSSSPVIPASLHVSAAVLGEATS